MAELSTTALSTFNVASPVNSVAPDKVRVPELVGLPNPKVPESESAFVRVRAVVESLEMRPPLKDKVPEPKAVLVPAARVPAERETPPPKALAPVRVRVEPPDLTSIPAAPLKVPANTLLEVPLRVRA